MNGVNEHYRTTEGVRIAERSLPEVRYFLLNFVSIDTLRELTTVKDNASLIEVLEGVGLIIEHAIPFSDTDIAVIVHKVTQAIEAETGALPSTGDTVRLLDALPDFYLHSERAQFYSGVGIPNLSLGGYETNVAIVDAFVETAAIIQLLFGLENPDPLTNTADSIASIREAIFGMPAVWRRNFLSVLREGASNPKIEDVINLRLVDAGIMFLNNLRAEQQSHDVREVVDVVNVADGAALSQVLKEMPLVLVHALSQVAKISRDSLLGFLGDAEAFMGLGLESLKYEGFDPVAAIPGSDLARGIALDRIDSYLQIVVEPLRVLYGVDVTNYLKQYRREMELLSISSINALGVMMEDPYALSAALIEMGVVDVDQLVNGLPPKEEGEDDAATGNFALALGVVEKLHWLTDSRFRDFDAEQLARFRAITSSGEVSWFLDTFTAEELQMLHDAMMEDPERLIPELRRMVDVPAIPFKPSHTDAMFVRALINAACLMKILGDHYFTQNGIGIPSDQKGILRYYLTILDSEKIVSTMEASPVVGARDIIPSLAQMGVYPDHAVPLSDDLRVQYTAFLAQAIRARCHEELTDKELRMVARAVPRLMFNGEPVVSADDILGVVYDKEGLIAQVVETADVMGGYFRIYPEAAVAADPELIAFLRRTFAWMPSSWRKNVIAVMSQSTDSQIRTIVEMRLHETKRGLVVDDNFENSDGNLAALTAAYAAIGADGIRAKLFDLGTLVLSELAILQGKSPLHVRSFLASAGIVPADENDNESRSNNGILADEVVSRAMPLLERVFAVSPSTLEAEYRTKLEALPPLTLEGLFRFGDDLALVEGLVALKIVQPAELIDLFNGVGIKDSAHQAAGPIDNGGITPLFGWRIGTAGDSDRFDPSTVNFMGLQTLYSGLVTGWRKISLRFADLLSRLRGDGSIMAEKDSREPPSRLVPIDTSDLAMPVKEIPIPRHIGVIPVSAVGEMEAVAASVAVPIDPVAARAAAIMAARTAAKTAPVAVVDDPSAARNKVVYDSAKAMAKFFVDPIVGAFLASLPSDPIRTLEAFSKMLSTERERNARYLIIRCGGDPELLEKVFEKLRDHSGVIDFAFVERVADEVAGAAVLSPPQYQPKDLQVALERAYERGYLKDKVGFPAWHRILREKIPEEDILILSILLSKQSGDEVAAEAAASLIGILKGSVLWKFENQDWLLDEVEAINIVRMNVRQLLIARSVEAGTERSDASRIVDDFLKRKVPYKGGKSDLRSILDDDLRDISPWFVTRTVTASDTAAIHIGEVALKTVLQRALAEIFRADPVYAEQVSGIKGDAGLAIETAILQLQAQPLSTLITIFDVVSRGMPLIEFDRVGEPGN